MSAPPDFTIYPQGKAIWSQIQSSSRILLHFHPNPDPDCVGSALALGLVMVNLGKSVTIASGDSPLEPWVKNLPGSDLVKIARISTINLLDYDLFIILDSSTASQISDQPLPDFPSSLKTIVIDHHPQNNLITETKLVDPESVSTSHILFNLLKQWNQNISPDIACNLYAGIHSDTMSFSGENTTPQSIRIAAELAQINPNFPAFLFPIYNSTTSSDLTALTHILQSIKLFFHDHVAITSVDSAGPQAIEKAVVLMRSVVGWDIIVLLREISPGQVRVSLRTRDAVKYDLSKLAATLGGGGHAYAAGATLNLSLSSAKKKVLSTISAIYPALSS